MYLTESRTNSVWQHTQRSCVLSYQCGIKGIWISVKPRLESCSTAWWLYTPNWYGYDNGYSTIHVVSENMIDFRQIQSTNSVRPAVTLKRNTTVATKSDITTYGQPGTYTNPYVIE